MVALSKVAQPGAAPFTQSDLFGSWRVYLQRVESKLAGSTTQIGQASFSEAGVFKGGMLSDAGPPLVNTPLTAGNLLVAANGSVTGTLAAGTLGTSDQYTLLGGMRAAKDVITGVLTANVSGRTKINYGLVTMVRDVTLFDLSQASYSVTEGNSLSVTVKRTGNLTTAAGVTWAVSGGLAGDFGTSSATLSFPANSTSQMFSLKTSANSTVDGNRSATIALSAPTGPGAMLGSLVSAPVAIIEDDRAGTFKLSATSYQGTELAKTALVTIQRSGGSASGVVVQFRTSDGTALAGRDYAPYTATNGSVTFSATDASKTIAIPIVDNGQIDGTRTFTFALTNVSANGVLGSPTQATVSIADNDIGGTLQFNLGTYSVPEGNVSTITVLRAGGVGSVLVDFTTADGTARAGHNYVATSGTLQFDSTNASKTFTIQTLDDTLIEGDNTVLLSLGNVRPTPGFVGADAKLPVLGALKSAVLTIKDAQKGLQFTSSNYSVSETAGVATVTVVRTGPLTDTATVRYSTSDGTAVSGVNYTPTSGMLTFAPAISLQSFPVKILPDKTVAGPKGVVLLLSSANSSVAPPAALGPRNSAVLTIADVDVAGSVKIGTPSVSVTTGVGSAVVGITRSGGTAGGVSVDYATCDTSTDPLCPGTAQAGIDYQTAVGTVTFAAGETTKTVQVVINSDPTVKSGRSFTLGLSNVRGGATLGVPAQATVAISDAVQGGMVQLGATTFPVSEPSGGANGSTSTMITVKRSGTNLADGASVIVLTGTGSAMPGMNYTPLATTVVFNANEVSKAVPLTILANGDNTALGNLTVPVILTAPAGGATLGTPASAMVTIMRANRSFQFSAPTTAVVEGATAAISVLRGGPATSAATVQWTASGDGTPGLDYKPASGTLSFAAGAVSAAFMVSTSATVPTGTNRSVMLTLQNPTAGYATGPAATLVVQDRDAAGTFQFASAASTVTEGAPLTLTVNRTGGTGGTATTVLVPWTTSPPTSDFSPPSGVLTFGPGATSKAFTITAATNSVLDNNRSSTLVLGTPTVSGLPSGALGPQNSSSVTVLDRNSGGMIQFLNATQVVAENIAGGVVNLPLTRSGTNLAGDIVVDYTITGDTSGVASGNGSVTFAAGAVTASIPVMVVNGIGALADRQLLVTLSSPRASNGVGGPAAPTLGPRSVLPLTITDSLPHVSLSAPSYAVTEGELATLTVVRSGPTTSAIVVNYATSDGTGTAGTHYTATSSSVTVPAGATRATFSVQTLNDGVLAGSHTFGVSLIGIVGAGASIAAPSQAVVTVQDKQSAGTLQFATSSASMLEGGVLRVTVTRTGANLVGGVTVGWSVTGGTASPGEDVTPTSGTLTFDAGVASQSFDLTSVGDGIATGTKTIVLSLDAPGGGAASGTPTAMTIFVVDAEQSVGFTSPTATVGETTAVATLQVARSGLPTGTVTVQYATVAGTAIPGLDYTAKSDTLTFGPGDVVKAIQIPILTANALTRNGNRALTVTLGAPSGAALNAASTATLTIQDFRADLVIVSVAPPSGALNGKTVSAPSTVRNLGPVAAPAFNVGIFIVRADAPDAGVPGAGALVATQPVAGLAAGASATFPTQFTLDDGFPAGDYLLSAVANFGLTIPEGDTSNNGRSASVPFSVKNNLTKFKSASAAFSQTSPPAGPRPAGPLAVTCNAQGTVNLTGTFQINSQQNNTATGQANLTGTLNDQPVQYLIGFTGTGDDNGNVTATLTSIVFKSLTSALTGTGTGALAGTLDGRTLLANVSGQFSGPLVGTCVFTGTLTAQAQTSFSLVSGTGIDGLSSFAFGLTPAAPAFPAGPRGAGVQFEVFFDSDYPDPSTVRITGPAGSNITNKIPESSEIGGDHARYRVGNGDRGNLPGGTWTVLYKGQTKTFTLAPFNTNASFVVVFPTVTVDADDNLLSISWVYRDRVTGANISAPSFMAGIAVRVESQSPGDQPRSPILSPAVTSFTLADAGFTNVKWSTVQGIQFTYSDLGGHLYEQSYAKAVSVRLLPQVHVEYNDFGSTCINGCLTRQLQVFVDTQTGLVKNKVNCPKFGGPPASPPFFVQIQNHDAATGSPNPSLPFNTPDCINFSFSGSFGGSVTVDSFSDFIDLDTASDTGGPVTLAAGTKFDVSLSTDPTNPAANRSTVVVVLAAAEADPVNDAVRLTVPSGFRLASVLNRTQTISWTAPTFPVASFYVNPNVYIASTGPGFSPFCSLQTSDLTDPPAGTTQATFTLPGTCMGKPVIQANVCVQYTGFNGETSAGCWTWTP